MTRKSFLMRFVKSEPPDDEALQKYLLYWRSKELYENPHNFPTLDSPHLFGNERPLCLEIGCSTGEYICSLAAKDPATNFLGVEINLKSLYVAVRHAADLSLDNIRFIKAPFQNLFPLLAPQSLQAVYLHFPDPSLHPKQRKRQILNTTLCDAIYTALVPGGTWSIVTDNPTLFTSTILPLIEGDSRFKKAHSERYLLGFEPEVKSRYQLYWEKLGATIYRVVLRSQESGPRIVNAHTDS
jgi:tRNA (guanine-N7-)-methyltransferase